MRRKFIKITDAVGRVLDYDLTKVIPGKFKGAAFRKGYVIKKGDIPELIKMGKRNLWVLELSKDEIHEQDAASAFARLAGGNVKTTPPREGKVNFIASSDGLLVVEREAVDRINRVPDVVLATRHSFVPVKKGETLAGMRIVPLATKRKNVERVFAAASGKKVFRVLPFKRKKVGLIVTGSEVAEGLIEDRFAPIIRAKLKKFGSVLSDVKILTDDKNLIKKTISDMKRRCDVLILAGGMSVDADDVTPAAIKESGAKIVSYGTPVLPGNMFLTAYLGNIPVFGVPAAAIFYRITSLDVFLPMALAGVKITKRMIKERGYGGLCAHCKICVYPNCAFGKR